MKAKTHQALKKRVRITASGKMIRKVAAVSHLRVNKSPRISGDQKLSSSDQKRAARMLPYG